MNYKDFEIVYVDMDGVMADFAKGVITATGMTIEEIEKTGSWDEVKGELCASNFFNELEVMPIVDILNANMGKWDIMTAVGYLSTENVIENKKLWISRVFNELPKFNYVLKSHEKAKFAKKGVFLIDDRPKSVNPFLEQGGDALLFNNSKEQLEFLKEFFTE